MIEFADLISNINPWYIVTVAVVLITVDIFLVNSETLLWVALALFVIAGGNAYDLPATMQLWSYPVAFILVLVAQRKIGRFLYRTPEPYKALDTYVGQTGHLRVRKSVTTNAQHFQSDASRTVLGSVTDMNSDGGDASITIVKIELPDGKQFPAVVEDGTEAKDGLVVKVTQVQEQQLVVRSQRNMFGKNK